MKFTITLEDEQLAAVIAALQGSITVQRRAMARRLNDHSLAAQDDRRYVMRLEDALTVCRVAAHGCSIGVSRAAERPEAAPDPARGISA